MPSNSNNNTSKPRTRYQIIKDGWGNRPNFQYSYGLKMTPEDIEEGNLILDEFVRIEREEWEERQREDAARRR
ncbi:hypothetical protein E1B28_006683 [Marasmius oreades]|uniref:Uncharacterized protein n=1 Tax=Marasmius oreades TaxID=181124 RepID=A0A9P7UWL4_9AGAR|nr:uncharacterized protein E1B28_006683 [Marasmius oreades]KAG7096001.1 hypothetical protein E1B28_006683 [Marasmius oreades]